MGGGGGKNFLSQILSVKWNSVVANEVIKTRQVELTMNSHELQQDSIFDDFVKVGFNCVDKWQNPQISTMNKAPSILLNKVRYMATQVACG